MTTLTSKPKTHYGYELNGYRYGRTSSRVFTHVVQLHGTAETAVYFRGVADRLGASPHGGFLAKMESDSYLKMAEAIEAALAEGKTPLYEEAKWFGSEKRAKAYAKSCYDLCRYGTYIIPVVAG